MVPLLLISGLIAGASLLLLVFYAIKEYKGIVFQSHAILMTLIVLCLCFSVIPWNIVPYNDSVCLSRLWLTLLSVTLCVGVTFAKAATVWFMFSLENAEFSEYERFNAKSSSKIFTHNILPIVMFCLPQLIILIVWTCVYPYRSIVVITDPIQRIGEYQCDTSTIAYSITECIFFAILGLFCIAMLIFTWRVNEKTTQARFALISVYNLALCGIIFLPLFIFLTTENSRSAIVAAILIFLAFQTVVTFYLPAFEDLGLFGKK